MATPRRVSPLPRRTGTAPREGVKIALGLVIWCAGRRIGEALALRITPRSLTRPGHCRGAYGRGDLLHGRPDPAGSATLCESPALRILSDERGATRTHGSPRSRLTPLRVFFTTNFDRRLEHALQAHDIERVGVTSEAALERAPAREDAECLVVKPHVTTFRNDPQHQS